MDLHDEAAAAATASTALDAAGLSLCAVTVAQRLGAVTVGELVEIPTRVLWRARGLSRASRLELVNRASTWRRTFAAGRILDASPAGRYAAAYGLDTLAVHLLPATSERGADQRTIARSLLGLPDENGVLPSTRWPRADQPAGGPRIRRAPRRRGS